MNIGRVGGNGAMPPWRPNPRLSSASLTAGMSSGTASMPRSTMFLPGSPGTAELPMCSATAPGHADAMQACDLAGDVLRGRVPRVERGGQALVRADGQVGHRPEV